MGEITDADLALAGILVGIVIMAPALLSLVQFLLGKTSLDDE